MADRPSTALVSGANKGLGLETARQLAARNGFVYIGARDLKAGGRPKRSSLPVGPPTSSSST